MQKLLVVDDEPIIRHSFQKAFGSVEIEVIVAATLAEGRIKISADSPDVIVLDLQLPDGSGLDLLKWVTENEPRRPVILITARGTADAAIEAMTRGAFDYLLKPLDLESFTKLVSRAFEAARLMQVPAELPDEPVADRILGRTPAVQEMCKQIGRVAPQNVNVLIRGESGTGKELVARAIYHHSRRSDKPFLAINCAALPDALVESELFGHEQGAFTGALRQRIGKFEQCDGGTLLLDEIGDMPLSVQAKMLRLLQEQQFERVGGNTPITTNVRVLAATNKNLELLITEGKFRSDLFYRLNVVTIHVPPLRERRADIPELAHQFLYRYAREFGRDVRAFSSEVLEHFQRAPWPGNVRELQGVIKESLLRATGHTIIPEFLPASSDQASEPSASLPGADSNGPSLSELITSFFEDKSGNVYSRVIARVERELIAQALLATQGHQAQASERLGINRTTLRNKLRELGISLDKVVSTAVELPTE
jgi:two-component system, NtrC family, nitrogen regulation response regulator GlnG